MVRTIIRSERSGDYAAIGAVNVAAFANRAVEALIVSLLRHHASFDPELSLVAEIDGWIAGHVLFTPYVLHLLSEKVPAVNLAPIAVAPQWQKQGIGGQLIREGHARALQKGYTLAFLLGHTSYYPRFGYRTHAYGSASVTVPLNILANVPVKDLTQRPLMPEDIPALHALWIQAEHYVDFALDPGRAMLDWLSPNPAIISAVYVRNDQIVGYSRIHSGDPARPRMLLARDDESMQAIAAHLASHLGGTQALTLPLHPLSRGASVFTGKAGVIWSCDAWGAAMACDLAPNPFAEYYAQVQQGKRQPGRVIWPVAFDLDPHA